MSNQIPVVFLPSGISRISPDGFESRDHQVCQEEVLLYKEKDKIAQSLKLNEKIPRVNPDTEMMSLDKSEDFLQDISIDDEDRMSDCVQDIEQNHNEKSPRPNSTEPSTANAKTLKTYQSHVRVFKDWLKLEGLPVDFEYCSAEELSSWLKKFYRDGRRKDGQQWKPSSLKIFRFAINQHLNSESVNRSISITRDKQFKEANMVISDRQKELIQLGEDATGSRESKDNARPLTCEDVRQLFDRGVIGVTNPKALHRYVFMILGINFGITTRLALHLLRPSMLYFDEDENSGLLYVQYDPKRDGVGADKKITKPKRKMYGVPGNPMCPVAALKLYVQKRNPECTDAFFHTPNRHYKETGVWYTPQATGKNTLGRLMKDIAIEGKLSFLYTNHCLRYTPPYVFTPPAPNAVPYRTTNGTATSLIGIQKEFRPLCNDPRPLQMRPTTANGVDCGNKLAMSSGVQFSVTDGKNYVNHATVSHSAPIGSIPLLYPPVKRSRILPMSASASQDEALLRDAKPSFSLRAGQLVPENYPKTHDNTRTMKAHNVLCVSKHWEVGDIIKAINAGDAIILSRQDLRAPKKDTTGLNDVNDEKEQTKPSTVRQDKAANEAHDQRTSFLKSGSTVKREACFENHPTDGPHLVKPVSSKLSSRSSRKQLEPKRIRPDEITTDGDTALQIGVAYDDAVTNIQANLTIIEKLQKDHPPSKQTIDELDNIRIRMDSVIDALRPNNHITA